MIAYCNTQQQREVPITDQSLVGISEVEVGVDNTFQGLHNLVDIPLDIPVDIPFESQSYNIAEEIPVQTGPEALEDEGDNNLSASPPPPPPPAKRPPAKRTPAKTMKTLGIRRKYRTRSTMNFKSKIGGNSKEPIDIE
nr:uncharacterized protein LOC109160617 [Ipomoea batatas]